MTGVAERKHQWAVPRIEAGREIGVRRGDHTCLQAGLLIYFNRAQGLKKRWGQL